MGRELFPAAPLLIVWGQKHLPPQVRPGFESEKRVKEEEKEEEKEEG